MGDLVVADPDAVVGNGEGQDVIHKGLGLAVALGRTEHLRQHLLHHLRGARQAPAPEHFRSQPLLILSRSTYQEASRRSSGSGGDVGLIALRLT